MCIICIDLEKERLTVAEARRNFGEMSVFLGEHAKEVEEMISKLEINMDLKKFLDDMEELEGDNL